MRLKGRIAHTHQLSNKQHMHRSAIIHFKEALHVCGGFAVLFIVPLFPAQQYFLSLTLEYYFFQCRKILSINYRFVLIKKASTRTCHNNFRIFRSQFLDKDRNIF